MRVVLAFLIAVGLVAIATPASAADASSVIDTSSIKITNNDSPGDPLTEYKTARIDFNFTTQGKTNADGQPIQPGDTFSITLPDVFSVDDTAWDVLSSDGEETVASCTLTAATRVVTCTFTDAINAHTYVDGNVWVLAQATSTTATNTVPIGTVNGDVEVPLPGNGPIGPSEGPGYPTEMEKWGWFANDERTLMYWAIFVPGESVAANTDLVINDTIGAGHHYDPSHGVVVMSTNNPSTSAAWEAVPAAAVTTVPAADGKSLKVTVAASAIQADRLYRVEYYTTADPGTNVSGFNYLNQADINGQTVSMTVTRSVIGGGSADGPGFGGIGVTKAVEGAAASLVPADTTFTVTASYTVDGAAVTKELSVTANGLAAELHELPVGTVVTLSEITFPAISGVTWGTPVFSNVAGSDATQIAPDGASAQITVADQQTIAVLVTNDATTAPPGTTAPSTTPPSTPPATTPPSTPPATTPPSSPPATAPATSAVPAVPSTPSTPMPSAPYASARTAPGLANTGVDAGGLGGIAIALIAAGLLATFGSRVRTRR